VTQNTVIGSYIVQVSIEFDLGEQKEKGAYDRVGTLFPNVTHLEFSSSERQTGLDLASRFRRITSLVTWKSLRNGRDLHSDSLSSMTLTSITCLPPGLACLLDWLDHAGLAQRNSLSKVRILPERMLLYNNPEATEDLCGTLIRLFKCYRNLEVLDLCVHQEWSETSSSQFTLFCITFAPTETSAFEMGECSVTHLLIRAPEDACPAVFGILRNTTFPRLAHIDLQLHQTPYKRDLHDFDPSDPK
jgi:hypothetical protein